MLFVCLFPIVGVSVAFPQETNNLNNGLHGESHFLSKNNGDNGICDFELSIVLKYSDKLWVDGVDIIVEFSNTITDHGLIEVQTHTFQVLDVEEVFNMDDYFVLSVN